MRSLLRIEPGICFDGAEKACREWGIDAFEELQEDEADRVPLREELIAARVRELGDKALGAELREIVAERGERVAFGGAAERFDDGGWISAVVKVLPAAMCAKRTSACIRASCRG